MITEEEYHNKDKIQLKKVEPLQSWEG